MSKFSSFIVFLFGLALIGGMVAMIVQRFIPKEKVVVPELVLPKSDLPPLELPSQDVYLEQLIQLYREGNLEAIREHVVNDFIPGRVLVIKSNHPSERDRAYIMLDREVRRCDQQGVSLIDLDPLVPRSSTHLKIDHTVVLVTWQQLRILEPFSIVTWCVPVR